MIKYKNLLKTVTLAQCCGLLAMLLFMNGFMLEYFTFLKISNSKALLLLSLPHWAGIFLIIYSAYFSDKFTKKIIGNIGHVCMLIGFACMIIIPFLPHFVKFYFVFVSILIYGAGFAMFASNWFALLNPSIPKEKRGHFFGIMRSSWQVVSIVVGFGVSYFLAYSNEILSYQIILSVFWFGLLARFIIYQKIPEVKEEKSSLKLKEALKEVFYTDKLMPFISYWFLITVFTCATPAIFVLLGKNILNYSSSDVINLGNAMGIGSVIGFLLGGKLVDKLGTKKVFIVCHLSYAFIISLFILRDFLGSDYFIFGMIISGLLGGVSGTSGIALTSELMGLLPKKNSSLASAVATMAPTIGFAFALPLVGILLESGIFAEKWNCLGYVLTKYDTLLIFESSMVLLLIVTLTIIPSVMKKAVWVPIRQER